MKRLLLCGLVLMFMSALLPHTTCQGFGNSILGLSTELPELEFKILPVCRAESR